MSLAHAHCFTQEDIIVILIYSFHLWSLPRLLSSLRRIIDVISIMRHVTTHHCGWEGADVSVYCHVDTSNSSPHPTTNIHLPVTESTAMHYYNSNVLIHVIISFPPTREREREFLIDKIQFSADILFVFCEWVTYSGLSPLELPISYFTVWLLKLPLKICAVLSNWKHKISIMISQYSVSRAVKYY